MLRFDLTKILGAKHFHFVGEAGEGVTAVVGPSGAGKTTLLNMIAGLIKPDSGQLSFNGTDITRLPPHLRRIGYVMQDQLLFPHMSVEGNLRYGLREGQITFDALVHFMALEALLARRPANLSGGEKQRVALGRTLLSQPQLLLLDEPLANLDQDRKNEILPYLESLQSRFNIPTLFVSHNANEVQRLADRFLHVAEGQIISGS
ncbi:ATP-binding cassette domain-containing protein [Aestuariivirga litoralis]|uniref:ATP-binding cassette domain-containing protein n=1 Tax=Aestuariivirga litoralis TaxID=2650924 RepID=UPI0018C58AE1|nr:ATP-binding cassette domain-containing protein [Aestuariivirga litoralis]MBG1232673.1 ATP-binding cassette domain-containing protein [Aestuariivirga litoralis]